MNEIMKNMDELKDKLFAAIDIICKDYEAKKPEFKVPGWIYWKFYSEARVAYIIKHHDGLLFEENGDCFEETNCRPATPQEIESHLRKTAVEKGFKAGIKAKFKSCSEERILHGEMFYKSDWLATEDALCFGMDVIWRPRSGWVEIIPDKKKLPKTKAEFHVFLGHWSSRHTKTTGEFLNEYES